MLTDIRLSRIVQQLFVERISVMKRVTLQKRRSNLAVPYLVDVFFALAAVARVKVGSDLAAVIYCYTERKPAVKRRLEPLRRNRVGSLEADAVHIRVYARVGAAAAF